MPVFVSCSCAHGMRVYRLCFEHNGNISEFIFEIVALLINHADHYLLFDFPGQVELFFLHSNAKNVIFKLMKKMNLRVWSLSHVSEIWFNSCCLTSFFGIFFSVGKLTVVHLVDAHLCCDPGKYVSALLLSLSTMLHLELPHINVLSKIDLVESYGRLGMSILWLVRCNVISSSVVCLLMWILSLVNMFLFPAAFNLDFYTDVQDLSYLQYHLDQDPRGEKFRFSSPFNHMHLELWVHKGLLGTLYL